VPVIKLVAGDAVTDSRIGMPGTHCLPVSIVSDREPVPMLRLVEDVDVTGAMAPSAVVALADALVALVCALEAEVAADAADVAAASLMDTVSTGLKNVTTRTTSPMVTAQLKPKLVRPEAANNHHSAGWRSRPRQA
jgi:hypothetical protein